MITDTLPPELGWSVGPRLRAGAATPGSASVLLLCHFQDVDAATIYDHIAALRDHSRHDVYVLCLLGDLPEDLDLDLFDAVVVHYSLIMAYDNYISPAARARIRAARGVRAAFVQDEYRWVDDTVAAMRAMGIEVLFTCVAADQVPLVYPAARLPQLRRTVTVLTGYTTPDLLDVAVPGYHDRPVEVGYRARTLPFWLGRLAQEKSWISERFQADADRLGITVDLSCREEDRIYGTDWTAFLARTRAVLGTESGASVFDFDGSVEQAVRDYLQRHPAAGFDEVEQAVLGPHEGRIRLNQISPRCFEAAALGTLLILYEGEYSGILEPWRHYVPLRKDHSNIDEVLTALRDEATWTRITTAARTEIAQNPAYAYPRLAATVDDALQLDTAGGTGRPDPAEFARIAGRTRARLPYRRLAALRLPRAVNWLRFRVWAVLRYLVPDPLPLGAAIGRGHERLHALRQVARRLQSLTYWACRPRLVPPGELLRGGLPLLEELSDLAALTRVASRCAGLPPGLAPFHLAFEAGGGGLTVRTSPGGSGQPAAPWGPERMAGVQRLALDLEEAMLVPQTLRPRRRRELPATSGLLSRHPGHGARLLRGVATFAVHAAATAASGRGARTHG